MITEPQGTLPASLATDAVTSADIFLSIASRSAASAPNPGSIARGASIKQAQNRTGSVSARSQDSHEVTPGGRAAAQSASSTLLPAPADPTTTVSRWPDPAASRSCSTSLEMSVSGSAGGRNFVSANRVLREEPCPATVPSAIDSWLLDPGRAQICALLWSGPPGLPVGARPTIVIRVTIGPRRGVRDITLHGGIRALFAS